jgi:hypothetical protein
MDLEVKLEAGELTRCSLEVQAFLGGALVGGDTSVPIHGAREPGALTALFTEESKTASLCLQTGEGLAAIRIARGELAAR